VRHNPVEYLGGTRIQLVFRNRESSILLSGDATLEHIAIILGEVSKRMIERPMAVYVTMDRPDC